jgi:hypothetical protein
VDTTEQVGARTKAQAREKALRQVRTPEFNRGVVTRKVIRATETARK